MRPRSDFLRSSSQAASLSPTTITSNHLNVERREATWVLPIHTTSELAELEAVNINI